MTLTRIRSQEPNRLVGAVWTLRHPSLATVAIALNAAIVLPLAALLNLWQDEAYTLHTTSRTLGYAYAQALSFEQNAPLYFVVMNLWRHIDGSVFFGRLFSFLCIALTLVLLPRLLARYLPGIDPGLATLAIALNPFTIWAALDMRVYALIVALSALLMLTFYDAFLARTPSNPWPAAFAYALVVALALYTQYYLAFLVAAQGVTLLAYARSAIPRYLAASALALLAFVPIVMQLPAQLRNFQGAFVAPDSPLQAAGTLMRILAQYVFPLHAFGSSALTYALALIIMVAALATLGTYFSRNGRLLLLAITLTGVLFLALALYIEQIHILNRHLAPFFLPAVLSTYAITTFIRPPARSRAVLALTCMTVILSTITLFSTYRSLAKPGDWIRVNAYLHQHESPREPIVVFEAENALPLQYYYRGPNRIVPIPQGVDFRAYDVSRFVIHDEAQLHRVMPAATRLWLVTTDACHSANIAFGCGVLDSYVAQNYHVTSKAEFDGSTVRLLVKGQRS
jgi:uncharacterized membrane protein